MNRPAGMGPGDVRGLMRQLEAAAGADAVRADAAECWVYGYDNSRRHAVPDAVVFPRDHDTVARIVRLCYERGVPVTARGRGTGTTGASVPVAGGVLLSFERMDQLIRLAPEDRIAVVQPGMLNQTLQERVGAAGFFWPPDPGSAAYCTIGGNLAHNAAGPRAVKYGTPRENTLGLHAVTGEGRTIRTGVATTKGVVGYDLTRLIIGSEGTLAIVTEATLRLVPQPAAVRTLRALYRDTAAAAAATSRIMAQPAVPRAVEFVDGTALALIRHQGVTLPNDAGAMLMLEADGSVETIDDAAAQLAAAARGDGLVALETAASESEAAALWAARKALSPALRRLAPTKINEDVVVPVSRIPSLIDGLDRLAAETGVTIVTFGHAGNGNLHVNLLADPAYGDAMASLPHCLERVFRLVLELGGTLSGEHGVGLEKRDFVAWEIEPETLELMHRIKAQFDPRGILNPLKKLPPRT